MISFFALFKDVALIHAKETVDDEYTLGQRNVEERKRLSLLRYIIKKGIKKSEPNVLRASF